MKVKVSVEDYSDARWGKGWVRLVESVDPESTNGYGITGDFLNFETIYEMEPGTLILAMYPNGSAKYHYNEAVIWRVTQDGLENVREKVDWKKSYIKVRDELIKLLDNNEAQKIANNEARLKALREYSLEELAAELNRRKGLDEEK